jgi:hypothetical protein
MGTVDPKTASIEEIGLLMAGQGTLEPKPLERRH